MVKTTPFYERTQALNETGLWRHWAGYLVADKYQASEKREYYAVRNGVGLLDTSPLHKYRVTGPDAESFLAGVLARDVRTCRIGRGQYTMWCDERGFVVEDGVVLRTGGDEYLLTSAEPNLAYFARLVGHRRAEIQDVSADIGILALQGPRSCEVLSSIAEGVDGLGYFGVTNTKIGDAGVIVSRTGYTGDLGYEIWVEADNALGVWDALFDAGRGRGLLPIGQDVLHMARIEAGLLLLDVDFRSSRFAWTDAQRATPVELGYGWMFRDLGDRAFVGRAAIERELADGTSRWRATGLTVDWHDYQRVHNEAGMPAPEEHRPVLDDLLIRDADGVVVGHSTSFMYSPILKRHIALCRVPEQVAKAGTAVSLEIMIDHRPVQVKAATTRLPFFDPPRRTA